MRGETLNIPTDISDPQEIASGGESITAQPGEAKKPDSEGHRGGGGIGGFLGGLVGVASKAAGVLTSAGKDAMDFAAGAGGAAAGGLASTFSAAAGDVGGLVSSVNGIQKAFPAGAITAAGLGAALAAQNLGRGASNWLASTGALLKSFDSLKPEVQAQVRDKIRQ